MELAIDRIIPWVLGIALTLLGIVIMIIAMVEFRSVSKLLGTEISNLVTTGIYRLSRNPQFLGLYFVGVGIALAGSSGYVLIIALLTVIFGHYYIIKLEEPYLELVFKKNILNIRKEHRDT